MREVTNAAAAAELKELGGQWPLFSRPAPRWAWAARAACRGADTEQFYPKGEAFTTADARVVETYCRSCPVRRECLEEALTRNEPGIWGGLTDKQRKALKRPRSRLSCPSCGNKMIHEDRIEVCYACGLTWRAVKGSEELQPVTRVETPAKPKKRAERATSSRSGPRIVTLAEL